MSTEAVISAKIPQRPCKARRGWEQAQSRVVGAGGSFSVAPYLCPALPLPSSLLCSSTGVQNDMSRLSN